MISVVINTFNAESTLKQCLETVRSFDEVVICDMYSEDSTLDIAKSFGCKIVMHERTGYVEPARNYAIAAATNPCVLVLDADELVPESLNKYLYSFTKNNKTTSGLLIPRANYFMGRFMRSIYPDYQLRFFQKDRSFWPSEIHSRPIINGTIDKIPFKQKELALVHIEDASIKNILTKMNSYTEKEQSKYQKKGKNYTITSAVLSALHRFIKSYFIKGGIFDGKAGFTRSTLDATYKIISIAKHWENLESQKTTNKNH